MYDAKVREKVTVSAPPTNWHSIDWKHATTYVRRLRQAIFQASKNGDLKRVRTLQRIMLRSQENRCLAVRRVTQTNAGKDTPGIDHFLVKTPEARARLVDDLRDFRQWKPLPARRVYIPKRHGKRPLNISSIRDRALQALVKNALEPDWESQFEDCSCGFRPGRSAKDAVERIFLLGAAHRKRSWVLDADIQGAFDNIDHQYLLDRIGNFPARDLIRQWLTAGYMEEGVFRTTESGTAQGSVISPLLANIAFHGMEEALMIRYRWASNASGPYLTLTEQSVALVRYADDFVVFCHTKREALWAKKTLGIWLAKRGLELSAKKTCIVRLEDGFDFLGFRIKRFAEPRRQHGRILLIKPSGETLKAIRKKLRDTFRACHGWKPELLIKNVNPIIRGWTAYFRMGTASTAFHELDRYLYRLQRRWTRREHPKKTWSWIRRKYWGRRPGTPWSFSPDGKLVMTQFSWASIQRHAAVRKHASWDDPALEKYWDRRMAQATQGELKAGQRKLAERQKGKCPHCMDHLLNGELLHTHHVIPRSDGGSDHPRNLQVLHLICHQTIHGSKANT